MNQIEFNYETYLEGKHKLQTRGGIEVPRENLRSIAAPNSFESRFIYSYKKDKERFEIKINGKGIFYYNSDQQSEHDLFMIPIQTDETIPFDLEKFKSGEWDVVCDIEGDSPLVALYIESTDEMSLIWEEEGAIDYTIEEAMKELSLKPKPITPFTHPELYEVSDDKEHWQDILKYYDYIDTSDWPHVFTGISGLPNKMKHLRLKQPTEISKDQAFDVVANLESVKEKLTEKFGTFKIK